MKLSTKNNINFLISALFVFSLGLTAFYFLLTHQMDKNIRNEMENRKSKILKHLSISESPNPSIKAPIDKNDIVLKIIYPTQLKKYKLGYSDTIIYDELNQKYIPIRRLVFYTDINHQKFGIEISKSLEESDRMLIWILMMMTLLTIIIISGMFFLNQHTSNKAWKVFYKMLKAIRKFNVKSNESFALENTEIKEFEDLNKELINLTTRIKKDYLNLKEYSENVSHELQTPLAVINSKMELLLQYPNYSDKQLKLISEVFEASNRLSKLNRTLILLTKIENGQFSEKENIPAETIINQQLSLFDELINSKKINLEINLDKGSIFRLDPYLAEILFSNLIKNAIRHNFEHGKIIISSTNACFTIANTGKTVAEDSTQIFERFFKSSPSEKSLGLGLSIVKKICETSNAQIKYFFDQNMHTFQIQFEKKQPKFLERTKDML